MSRNFYLGLILSLMIIVTDTHGKCFEPMFNSYKIPTYSTYNDKSPGCNLCAATSTASTVSKNATFESSAKDVLQMRMKCAWKCASCDECVGFNFKKSSNGYVHCQLFAYTPLLFISNNSCLYSRIITTKPVQNEPGLYSRNPNFCKEYSTGKQYFVMQRRMDGSENFFRNWTDYRNGFGDPCKEFWIGLNVLHRLTSSNKYKLLIVLEDFDENVRCAAYDSFTVDSPSNNYVLRIGSYAGTAGDSLRTHDGMAFSTLDGDHDAVSYNCAESHSGAWWYNACHQCNLNGLYLPGNHSLFADGVNWKSFRGYTYSLKFVEMRVELA